MRISKGIGVPGNCNWPELFSFSQDSAESFTVNKASLGQTPVQLGGKPQPSTSQTISVSQLWIPCKIAHAKDFQMDGQRIQILVGTELHPVMLKHTPESQDSWAHKRYQLLASSVGVGGFSQALTYCVIVGHSLRSRLYRYLSIAPLSNASPKWFRSLCLIFQSNLGT